MTIDIIRQALLGVKQKSLNAFNIIDITEQNDLYLAPVKICLSDMEFKLTLVIKQVSLYAGGGTRTLSQIKKIQSIIKQMDGNRNYPLLVFNSISQKNYRLLDSVHVSYIDIKNQKICLYLPCFIYNFTYPKSWNIQKIITGKGQKTARIVLDTLAKKDTWTIKELSEQTHVSIPALYNLRRKLVNSKIVEMTTNGFNLTNYGKKCNKMLDMPAEYDMIFE